MEQRKKPVDYEALREKLEGPKVLYLDPQMVRYHRVLVRRNKR